MMTVTLYLFGYEFTFIKDALAKNEIEADIISDKVAMPNLIGDSTEMDVLEVVIMVSDPRVIFTLGKLIGYRERLKEEIQGH